MGTVLVVILFMAVFGYAGLSWDRPARNCSEEYAKARSAADTAAADRYSLSARPNTVLTCGMLRRDGTLARSEAARARRGEPDQ